MIKKISHITFVVSDLDQTGKMFKDIFQAEELYSSDGKEFSISKEKFFLIGDLWIAIMEGEKIEKSYNHIAFEIQDADFEYYNKKIKGYGLQMREDRNRVSGEGRSIYFYDYDNHLFELHTGTLKQRLKRYAEDVE